MLVRDWKKEIAKLSNNDRIELAESFNKLLAWQPFYNEYKELRELELLLIHLNNG